VPPHCYAALLHFQLQVIPFNTQPNQCPVRMHMPYCLEVDALSDSLSAGHMHGACTDRSQLVGTWMNMCSQGRPLAAL